MGGDFYPRRYHYYNPTYQTNPTYRYGRYHLPYYYYNYPNLIVNNPSNTESLNVQSQNEKMHNMMLLFGLGAIVFILTMNVKN